MGHGLTAELSKIYPTQLPPDNTGRSRIERMPRWMICIPIGLQWAGLALRYRSITLPSSANPALTSGGLVGEGKLEYFNSMGALARKATAAFHPLVNFVNQAGHANQAHEGFPTPARLQVRLSAVLQTAGLSFPLVVKPDLGLCGYGVRRIDSIQELQAYLAVFPARETVVLQQYLPQEGEAGIFYVRHPATGYGQIIGLALRYFPRVTGDGRSTVGELMARDVRALRALRSSDHQCPEDLARVPLAGEVVRLSTVGSTRVGGLYRDGKAYITKQLTEAIDAIAQDMREFHFGRFDVRFDDLPTLCAGKGFTIMEVNGAGSEAIQAWDPDTGLVDSFRMIFSKQRLLFSIGNAMRERGFKPISLIGLLRLQSRQQKLIAQYPPSN